MPPPAGHGAPGGAEREFPDSVRPTKIHYAGDGPPRLHLRRCRLVVPQADGTLREHAFDGGEVRLGAMDDNDVVVQDDTVSRYHCRIVQEDQGYVLVDLRSTNGTFVDRVRVREAFLRPGCRIQVGRTELEFHAAEEEVEIVPSRQDRCGDVVGRHPRLRELYAIIEKVAPTHATVVIEGETGTGKEVVANTIHKLSGRERGPLVVFDCGAAPANLVESELFGHEKGSFTGAIMTRQGLFEMADGGTLFLDELGELPLELQPKLLRALEQREIRRVGGNRSIEVNVRVLAATHRDLEEEVRAGRFRQDLFYRLSVVRLVLPPLRERIEDVPLLVRHFLRTLPSNRLPDGSSQRIKGLSREAQELMQAYRWPGNVRELVNAVDRAVSFADGDVLEARDLPDAIRAGSAPVRAAPVRRPLVATPPAPGLAAPPPAAVAGQGGTLPALPTSTLDATFKDATFKDAKERWVAAFEREYVAHVLRKNHGNISHAAREADIDRKYFRKLMRKYDVEPMGAGADGAADEDDDA